MQKILANSRELVSFTEVQSAISRQAKEINEFIKKQLDQKAKPDVVAICLLNGGIIYSGMLLPMLDFNLQLDSISVSRYGKRDVGGDISWHSTPRLSLQGKIVLLLDDIFDQGTTLAHVQQWCLAHGAKSAVSCVLAWKELGEHVSGKPDFYALRIPDKFVVGMGMDYAESFRNAPGIFVLPELDKD